MVNKITKDRIDESYQIPQTSHTSFIDDAVLVAKSAEEIQFLDVISVYCEQWELNVNVSTTKIIFVKKKYTSNPYI